MDSRHRIDGIPRTFLFVASGRFLAADSYFCQQIAIFDVSKLTSVQSVGGMQVLHKMERDIVTHPSLLLADDNPALLETLIEMLEPSYRVAAALCNGTSVLAEVPVLRPDLIILDISLGDLTGFEVATRLRDIGCPAKIIFLSVHEDIDFVNAAFDMGACGYVFKSRISADLTKAIDIVFSGGHFASNDSPWVH